jgi:hypothetical protein
LASTIETEGAELIVRMKAPALLGAMIGICSGPLVLTGEASAALVLSPPIALNAPQNPHNATRPLIQYDPVSQVTFIAWSNAQQSGVEMCVVPASTSKCSAGGRCC